jgi:hypothetical protein
MREHASYGRSAQLYIVAIRLQCLGDQGNDQRSYQSTTGNKEIRYDPIYTREVNIRDFNSPPQSMRRPDERIDCTGSPRRAVTVVPSS